MKLSTYFDPTLGDILAPADILAFKVRDILAADTVLSAIFKPGAIEIVDRLRGHDYREFPRLQVSAYSSEEVAGVTNNDSARVRLYIRVRYEDAEWEVTYSGESESIPVSGQSYRTLAWPFGVPTMASIEWRIFMALKADEGLMVVFPNDTADLAHLATFGPSNYSEDEPDPTTGRIASNHTIQVEYQINAVHSDRDGGTDAGKIHNAAANGG